MMYNEIGLIFRDVGRVVESDSGTPTQERGSIEFLRSLFFFRTSSRVIVKLQVWYTLEGLTPKGVKVSDRWCRRCNRGSMYSPVLESHCPCCILTVDTSGNGRSVVRSS